MTKFLKKLQSQFHWHLEWLPVDPEQQAANPIIKITAVSPRNSFDGLPRRPEVISVLPPKVTTSKPAAKKQKSNIDQFDSTISVQEAPSKPIQVEAEHGEILPAVEDHGYHIIA